VAEQPPGARAPLSAWSFARAISRSALRRRPTRPRDLSLPQIFPRLQAMRVLGIDCGSDTPATASSSSTLPESCIALQSERFHATASAPIADRLNKIFQGLQTVIERDRPEEVAIEERLLRRQTLSRRSARPRPRRRHAGCFLRRASR